MRAVLLFAIKAFHSAAFAVIQSAIMFLLFKGFRRQSDRASAIAAGIAVGECAVYAANGFRCPLTDLAEDLGAQHGAVTDIYLPDWLAANIARIYTPLLAVGMFLHARNLRSRRTRRTTGGATA